MTTIQKRILKKYEEHENIRFGNYQDLVRCVSNSLQIDDYPGCCAFEVISFIDELPLVYFTPSEQATLLTDAVRRLGYGNYLITPTNNSFKRTFIRALTDRGWILGSQTISKMGRYFVYMLMFRVRGRR